MIKENGRMRKGARIATYAALFAFLVWSFVETEFSLSRLFNGLPDMKDFLKAFLKPDLDPKFLRSVLKETLLTIQVGFVGTVLAAVLAAPLSFLAAENINKSRFLRFIMRTLFNALRSVDILVFALVFVVAVGLGPFTAVLALSFHSVGMLGKLFYEAIEHIKYGPIEAIKAVGGGRLEIVRWAVIPQAAPFFISYLLYRLELNIRMAVVLGIVGAGGIGQMLTNHMSLHNFSQASVIIVVIFLLVLGLDALSGRLRRQAK